jgi:hypothetical protein
MRVQALLEFFPLCMNLRISKQLLLANFNGFCGLDDINKRKDSHDLLWQWREDAEIH